MTHTNAIHVNGEKLRKRREKLGLTATQVDAAIGVGERTYQRIEKDGDPRVSELFSILRALSIPLDEVTDYISEN